MYTAQFIYLFYAELVNQVSCITAKSKFAG